MNHKEAIDEIEKLTLEGELNRAAGLLVWTRGAFALDAPDVFSRALAREPDDVGHYMWRAKLKWYAALDMEALEDQVRALLVGGDLDFVRHWAGGVAAEVADREDSAPWLVPATASVLTRIDGDEAEERRHVLDTIDASPGEVAAWVALARIEQGTGSPYEVVALRNVLERARGWSDGWLRLLRALRQSGDEAAADRLVGYLRRSEPPG